MSKCINWHGSYDRGICYGYINGVRTNIARYTYEQNIGSIPVGMRILRTCENTYCVNPEHLTVGMHGIYSEPEYPSREGEANNNRTLTEGDVIEMRKFHRQGYKLARLSKMFHVSKQQVCRIVNHKAWTHI